MSEVIDRGNNWMGLLTPAERRIAELVALGYPNRRIASELSLQEQSVRNQVSRIFKKTGISNRVELALLVHGLTARQQTCSTATTQSH